ncbi:MAG TPA: nucleotidyltransferase [bacterium]
MKDGEKITDDFTLFFIESLKHLKSIFEKRNIDYAILGGLAAGAWGRSRATDDIDLVVFISEKDLEEIVRNLKDNGFEIRFLGPSKPPDLIQVTKKRRGIIIRIDLMLAHIPYQEETLKRKVWLKIFNIEVPVISPEDLIVHKLIANRPIDIQDVENVFQYNFKNLNLTYLKKWAKEWDIEPRLNAFIKKYSNIA